VGGAGSTGRGEENIRACGAHTVVENMRHGMSPKEAALDALKRVVRNFDNDMDRLAQVDLQFYALRKDGEYAGATLWGPRPGAQVTQFAVCSSDRDSHHEDCVYLLQRK
jgi:N4-(beta-N-acetylglucosaminyl)-L-asparaginase